MRYKCVDRCGIMIPSYAQSRSFQVTLGSLFVMSGRLLMMIGGAWLMRVIVALVRHSVLLQNIVMAWLYRRVWRRVRATSARTTQSE